MMKWMAMMSEEFMKQSRVKLSLMGAVCALLLLRHRVALHDKDWGSSTIFVVAFHKQTWDDFPETVFDCDTIWP